ncbi:uncharacterized protein BXZ73DRAFT_105491 [Epithele typhae]|uniref:uncharacterized protein n=1 Tax=Epithele typhae TaxID=378194 RepID=UPI002007FD39|nr:uncharacterized protein BXZ73DRAFT_105491 [Epithele typhae]KAH9917669.1 hypothetical protein BXZ73DRAFT_105491 [Epithele typhae]
MVAPFLCTLRLLERKEDVHPWIHVFPFIFPKHLSATRHLTLSGIKFDCRPLHPWSFQIFGLYLASLTDLTIDHGSFYDFGEFQRLIGAFGKLEALRIENVGFLVAPQRSTSAHVPDFPPVTLFWFDSKAISSISHALSGAESGELQLSMREWTGGLCIDLSRQLELRGLHLRDVHAGNYAHLDRVLRSLPRPALLNTLVVDLHLCSSGELPVPRAYWEERLNLLFENVFAGLALLRISLDAPLDRPSDHCHADFPQLLDTLRSWMPASLLNRPGLWLSGPLRFVLPSPLPSTLQAPDGVSNDDELPHDFPSDDSSGNSHDSNMLEVVGPSGVDGLASVKKLELDHIHVSLAA